MGKGSSRQMAGGASQSRMIISGGVLLCLILSVVLLYPAARSYYIACRVNEQLLQELVAVEDRNEQIRAQIAYLNTDEGIEDRARERFGWMHEGEQGVNITGLEISDSTTVLPATIPSGSVPASDNWWTGFCDVLFGVEQEDPPQTVPDPFIADIE